MATANPELTSSGEFSDGTPESEEGAIDFDLFAKPAGLPDDASAEDVLRYDPVEDSENQLAELIKSDAAERAKTLAEREKVIEQEREFQATKTEGTETPTQEPVQSTPETPEGKSAKETPAPTPVVPQAPSEVELLRAQLAQQATQMQGLVAQMQALQAQPQQPQQQPYQQPGVAAQRPQVQEDPLPNYQYNMAPQLVEAIRSEDPQQTAAGLSALVSEVATAVHTQLRNEYREWVPKQAQEIAQTTYRQQTTNQSERARIRGEFFGTYPQFGQADRNNDLDPLIQQVTASVLAETNLPWGDVVKNTVAARLNTILTGAQVVQPGTVRGHVAPVQNPAQAAMQAPGTRAGGPRDGNQRMRDDIADTLFGFSGNGDHPTGSFG